jgi:predicted nucleic acid-binding protein
MYLLDTNVVSEIGRVRAHRNVFEWSRSVPQSTLFLSVITLAELEQGVLRIERRDANQGAQLRRWFEDRVLPGFAGRILSVDEEIARTCARLNVPDPAPAYDALIAATAIVHRLTVATRNTSDFARMGATLFNPWDYEPA